MLKKIKDIKQKIKFAKIGAIIFWIIFLALIVNSVYLTVKLHKLQKKIHRTSSTEETVRYNNHKINKDIIK